MADRLKLKITEVKEPRAVGSAEVLDFFAVIGDDTKTARYGVWSKSLYEYIKKDVVIDCEVEVKTSEKKDPDGNPYVTRKVTQIFVDGKPVKTPTKSSEGKWRGRNEDRTDARTAVMEIGEDWRAGKIKDDDILIKQRRQWLSSVLPKAEPEPKQEKAKDAPQSKSGAVKAQPDTFDRTWFTKAFENIGDSRKVAGWLSDLGYVVDKKLGDKSYTDVVARMKPIEQAQLRTWINEATIADAS